MRRKIRSNLPLSDALLKHNVNNFKRDFQSEKQRYKKYYDCVSRPLAPLPVNARVLLYNFDTKLWDTKGVVICEKGIRSYLVKTDNGAIYTRNRVHLKQITLRRFAAGT